MPLSTWVILQKMTCNAVIWANVCIIWSVLHTNTHLVLKQMKLWILVRDRINVFSLNMGCIVRFYKADSLIDMLSHWQKVLSCFKNYVILETVRTPLFSPNSINTFFSCTRMQTDFAFSCNLVVNVNPVALKWINNRFGIFESYCFPVQNGIMRIRIRIIVKYFLSNVNRTVISEEGIYNKRTLQTWPSVLTTERCSSCF